MPGNHLGHYDPAHNAIVVSRVFDDARVPRYAVEYIVYHEMLHLKHPVKLRGSRRCVHWSRVPGGGETFPGWKRRKVLEAERCSCSLKLTSPGNQH